MQNPVRSFYAINENTIEIALDPAVPDLWLWRKSLVQGLKESFVNQVSINQGFDKVMMIAWNAELSLDQIKSVVGTVINQLEPADSSKVYKWNIPICYHTDSEDVQQLVSKLSLSVTEIIEMHQKAIYRVEFIGFLPGFPYLSGLPEQLKVPRKERPSPKVASGSVAIAAGMCGIYPQPSPGGWYVLGESPLPFFSVQQEQPSFLNAGDEVCFYTVDAAEFERIKNESFNSTTYRHE
ncbi:MAG: carboxyltransferase domain-containing protein [Nonlabens sp.]